jgi:hypothetical protein
VRFNIFFQFKALDGTVALLPSKLNPFSFNTLAECLAALAGGLPDYTRVGVTPVGVVIESVTEPILGVPAK